MGETKVAAIIVAAGKGTRMNKGYNKQYVLIEDKPLLAHTIEAIAINRNIDYIILVVPKEEVSYCKTKIIDKYNFHKVKSIVAGGEERKDSVYEGIKSLDIDTDIVLIHDGARPFITYEIINECIKEAISYGAAITAVQVKDTIKEVNLELIVKNTPKREYLWAVQTPQVFKYNIIKEAYEEGLKKSISATDDSMMVEALGRRVKVVLGTYENIKITTPEDLIIANQILQRRGNRN